MGEIALKFQSGLGDSIYAYPVVKHFCNEYDKVHVMAGCHEIFDSLPKVTCHRHLKLNYVNVAEGKTHRKLNIAMRFSYGPGKHRPGTSQYEDMLRFGRTQFPQLPDLPLEMPWSVRNEKMVCEVRGVAKNRPIAVIAAPYQPFGRTDKWGEEIKINPDAVQKVIDSLKEAGYLCILVGNEFTLHEPKVEWNMVNDTNIADLLDLCYISDMMVSQVGNFVPIAEVFNKKNVILFSKRIKTTDNRFLSAIRPEKIIHKKDINLSFYDNEVGDISAFCK